MKTDDHFIEYLLHEETDLRDLFQSDEITNLPFGHIKTDKQLWEYAQEQVFNFIKPINFFGMVYNSPIMQSVVNSIMHYAVDDDYVLILGETGTGKSHCAKALHHLSKRKRAEQRFKGVNCSRFREDTAISELFGHERGAFTDAGRQKIGLFEFYKEGTLFLDEIDSLHPSVQGDLLLFLDNKKFTRLGGTTEADSDVRLIFGSNKILNDEKVREKEEFRDDLYHRISKREIELPPVRDRDSDVFSLIEHFLTKNEEIDIEQHIDTALLYGANYHILKDLIKHVIGEFISKKSVKSKGNKKPALDLRPIHFFFSEIQSENAKSLLWTQIFNEDFYPPIREIFQKDDIDFVEDFLNKLFLPLLPPESIYKQENLIYFTIFEYWDFLLNPWKDNVRGIDKLCGRLDLKRFKSESDSSFQEIMPSGIHFKELIRRLIDKGITPKVIRKIFDDKLHNHKMSRDKLRVSDTESFINPAYKLFDVYEKFATYVRFNPDKENIEVLEELLNDCLFIIPKSETDLKSIKLEDYMQDREQFLINARINQMKNRTNIEIAKSLGICTSTFYKKCDNCGINIRESKQ